MVLICDFTTGFKSPEMVKRRPVVVISPKPNRKKQLCIVVPLSTTPPSPLEPIHHQMDPASLPGNLALSTTWAKCDMMATVSLDRLDRIKLGKDATGKRLYVSHSITKADLKAIQQAVLHAIGLSRLTKLL
jgi:uncharacterized protein YifN (PemK superfamily)